MHSSDKFFRNFESLVTETGEFLRKEAQSFSSEKVEHKGRNDLVSYVDKTAEDMIVAGCEKLIPGSSFIKEESGIFKGTNDYTWIIDPLDGTTNFVHGLPIYSISIALQKDEKTIFGCVYAPEMEEMFTAYAGEGALLNGDAIQVSQTPELAQSLIVTGFPYAGFGRMDDLLSVFKNFSDNCHGLRRLGSAAIDLSWTACGRFDGFYELNLNSWDIAAGALIVAEAGGKVTDLHNGSNFLFGKEIAASNGQIHTEMLSILDDF